MSLMLHLFSFRLSELVYTGSFGGGNIVDTK
jgi:hypothetical protein